MYAYHWDEKTGGLLLETRQEGMSKEPRPVYYKELDILGFDKYWQYKKSDERPYMWAEANNYFYKGAKVAHTVGGSLYTAPEIKIDMAEDAPELNGTPLEFVDIEAMVDKNRDLMEKLAAETIKKIYNTYKEYKAKVDVFYVAFSGGKDSVVTLDLVQRALPHNEFKVLFGDTGMEFPDTYKVVEATEEMCRKKGIDFYRTKSELDAKDTWNIFGPPAVTNRWCCSVHKTSPQIRFLQAKTQKQGFRGMAFTGVRGDESASRSEYNDVSFGEKHRGQYSCHPILDWGSAELFNYIYYVKYILQDEICLNEAYLKGNSRVGCIECPMSAGKHEYMKHQNYPEEMEVFIDRIRHTSGKTDYSEAQMTEFIDNGWWRTRKSGRELNFGQDKHYIDRDEQSVYITILVDNPTWKEWAKTIGEFTCINENIYTINYKQKIYRISYNHSPDGTSKFILLNCGKSKDDVKFASLFRGVIVKSIYCVNCGVCAANCSLGCIDMTDGVKISDDCVHCHQCHDIYESCLRYNSIRNTIGGERKMAGLDRYYTFGIRKNWMDIYFEEKGGAKFWVTDGKGEVPNKKKEAFLNFVKDAEMVRFDKSISTVKGKFDGVHEEELKSDKFTKCVPTDFAKKLFLLGSNSDLSWALMLCNLAYTPQFNWYIKNLTKGQVITPDYMQNEMLKDAFEGDIKGLGRRNMTDALKIFLVKTPFGKTLGLGDALYEIKISASKKETITLFGSKRTSWENPDPRVILYSLYKFAEACDGYYQFTLTRLLDHGILSDGVSPTEIFGLERDQMEKLLNNLSINYPEFINASFTLYLDTITLNNEKKSGDVLTLF